MKNRLIHLQDLLGKGYQAAVLNLAIDYTQQPIPPVSTEDFAWMQT
jgi:hypothetical protein